jgi:uncharacterized protein (DUF849 family)
MLIQAAINGSRSKVEHPHVPLTSAELAAAAEEAAAAGAEAIHFHARSEDGRETLDGAAIAANLESIRERLQDLPVGVSTGAWIVPDPERRLRIVQTWDLFPDFVSVNFHEEGAVGLAATLMGRGIGIEAGISDTKAARKLVASGLARQCLRILVEPQDEEIAPALKTTLEIENILNHAGVRLATVLHGTDGTAWELLDEAIRRGYDIRIGFEDTLRLRDGKTAQSNAELVREARTRVESLGSEKRT